MSLDTERLAREIEKDIKQKANKVLKKVANDIRMDLASRATSEVYGEYDPDYYERRFTLEWPRTYDVEVGDLEITITPIAPFNRRYGGWNYGDELGGFMNFGRGWHGYVMGGMAYKVPLPRPYLTNAAQDWNYKIQEEMDAALGEWSDVVTAKITLGGE